MYGYRYLKGFKESTGVHPMKILTQSNIPSNLPAHINPYLGKVGTGRRNQRCKSIT